MIVRPGLFVLRVPACRCRSLRRISCAAHLMTKRKLLDQVSDDPAEIARTRLEHLSLTGAALGYSISRLRRKGG